MCVGPTMPISNFRRQAMTRQLSRAPAEGNTQSKHEWEDPGDSRQQGLLPKSNSQLSGYPTGRPSLGRWWLNVQPKHYTHTCTHIKIKTKNKNQPPTIQNLKTKPPMSTLKVKALSPGKQYHSGQQAQWGRTLLDERKLLPSHSSPLVLSSQKKVWNTSSTPKKKESDSATIFKRFSKAKKKKKSSLWLQGLNQIDYILCSQRCTSSIQSAKTRPGADCGSDHDSLLPNSDLNWRKWGKPLDHSGMT